MCSVEVQTDCSSEVVCGETQTTRAQTQSREIQTLPLHPPPGYLFVGMFGDSHMKTCYKFLIKLLENEDPLAGLVHDIHEKENVLINSSAQNRFRYYHSTYVNHTHKVFIEFVFITSVFDTYLELHTSHRFPVVHNVLFVNSAMWDIKTSGCLREYETKLTRLMYHVASLPNRIKLVGLIVNSMDPERVLAVSPFYEKRLEIKMGLGHFNACFARIFSCFGRKTFCVEPAIMASDGIHYGKHSYVEIA